MIVRSAFLILRSAQCALALMIPGASAIAQTAASVDRSLVVAGRVLRPGAEDFVPVRGIHVTLHRVGRDRAGPLDSVRTDAAGRYEIRYRRSGEEAAYFAAAVYGGVAYFTPVLPNDDVRGEGADIIVFDTTSVRVPLAIRGRHLIVSGAAADATRSVMEVFELANDSTVTLVSPTEASAATWSVLLPRGARDARAAQGDVPREAMSFTGGVVSVVSPMPPGVKQVAYSYVLDAESFPLRLTLNDAADVYEVLLEDPSGRATGGGLEEVDPVHVEGRRFRRFLAQDVPPNTSIVIDIPRVRGGWDPRYLVALTVLVGLAMIGALMSVLRRRT